MNIPKTRKDADGLLKRLCELRSQVSRMQARAREKTLKIEAEAAAEAGPLQREDAAIVERLERYFVAERAKLPEGKRSLKLNFGRIGMRARNAVERVRHWESDLLVLAALKGRALVKFIRQIEAINREAVLAADAEELKALEQCGLRVERGEKFFCEPDLRRLEEDAVDPQMAQSMQRGAR